jgi:hypothetical protein
MTLLFKNYRFYFLFFKFCIVILFSIFYFLDSGKVVFAAELFFAPDGPGALSLFINTEGERINALEGTVVAPAKNIVQGITNGDSIISLWIKSPTAENISFAGMIPGGYVGARGKIFSLKLGATKIGGPISITNARVLLHDGAGSAAPLTISPYTLMSEQITSPLSEDKESPEVFQPIITQDANVFEGKKFLIFIAQDKQSGINHYEVSENGGAWVVAVSPYLLRDQELSGAIRVRAVDQAGNIREVAVGIAVVNWYLRPWLWIILIICSVLFLLWLSLRNR